MLLISTHTHKNGYPFAHSSNGANTFDALLVLSSSSVEPMEQMLLIIYLHKNVNLCKRGI